LDTVNLNGKGFTALKKCNETVKQGEVILMLDEAYLKDPSLNLTTCIFVTNTPDYQITHLQKQGAINSETCLLEIERKK